MSTPSESSSNPESFNLAALGRNNVPASVLDATPEVSELLQTMPWWASRGLVYIVGGFTLCAILWAGCTPIDTVTQARGAFIPEGNVRLAQALEAGKVRFLLAREGQIIEQGDPIVKLDDSELKIRQRSLMGELAVAEGGLLSLRTSSASPTSVIDAEARLVRLRSEIDAVELSLSRTMLTAPVAGVITSLSVRGQGEVVESGQAVATISPKGARLVAEARVPNEKAGQVKPGMQAKLLLDAFPYQRYGAIDAEVLHVSPDAVAGTDGSYYRVILSFDPTKVPKGVRVRPGLALEAQIVTERRNALRMFLDPMSGTGADQ